MKNIPLIIPVFNQPTYLINLINWWRWYFPDSPVYIIDNGSEYGALLDFYGVAAQVFPGVEVHVYRENAFIANMRHFLDVWLPFKEGGGDYYVISDPDIMPHPATPMNFLEVWKDQIDNHGFHRAGFNLITSDLPTHLYKRDHIIHDEQQLLKNPVMSHGDHVGYRAPIDTTFCLYKASNGGWSSPMGGEDWGNCLRLFSAFHLMWYLDGNNINKEMEHYFNTAKYRVPGEPSAGKNNSRPERFITE